MELKIHDLKLNIEFCEAVASGEKSFEVRENDRGYQKGDLISFQAVSKTGLLENHRINGMLFKITYVLSGWGIKKGFVVFGIKEAIEAEI